MSDYRPIYFCDPEKNTECSKTGCVINGGPCRRTANVNYAVRDKNGFPVEDRSWDFNEAEEELQNESKLESKV